MIEFRLDDSGEQSEPIQTLAGYITTTNSWAVFEAESKVYFDEHGIEYLHTKDLFRRTGQFKGWNSLETRQFAEGLFQIAGKHIARGVEFSVRRDLFNTTRKLEQFKREGSPFAFCFKGLVTRTLQDETLAPVLAENDEVDLSFVIESGHKNQNNILREFERLKPHYPKLRALLFEDKRKLRGLQIADFLAFYCRRVRVAQERGKPFEEDLKYLEEVTSPVSYGPFLATDFW